MNNPADTIDRYCMVWSEPDATKRAALLATVWAEDATYSDPNVYELDSRQLLAQIEKVQINRPGARVLRTTALDQHHSFARFGFKVIAADGTLLREGVDVVFFTEDGTKLTRIIGFFGPLSPL